MAWSPVPTANQRARRAQAPRLSVQPSRAVPLRPAPEQPPPLPPILVSLPSFCPLPISRCSRRSSCFPEGAVGVRLNAFHASQCSRRSSALRSNFRSRRARAVAAGARMGARVGGGGAHGR